MCLLLCSLGLAWVPSLLWAQSPKQEACVGESVTFPTRISSKLGRIVRWTWNFDDPDSREANCSQLRQPEHVFEQPGIYRVSLVIETERGIKDSIFTTVQVHEALRLTLQWPDSCRRDTLALFAQGSRPLQQVCWRMGESWLPDSQASLRHVPDQPGELNFLVRARDSLGCRAEIAHQVTWPLAPPPPQVQGDTVCFGEKAKLQAQASSGSLLQWLVRASGDSLEVLATGGEWQTPALSFSQTYYARQIDSSSQCASPLAAALALVLEAEDGRLAHRISNPERLPAQVDFRVITPLQPIQYQWDFGEGEGSQAAAPSHTYRQPGRYQVSATLTYRQGCVITLRSPVYIKAPPAVALPSAFSPNGDGFNDAFSLEHAALQSMHLRIFDRQGQLVYETRDPAFRWDGRTLLGNMVREGIYVCLIQGRDLSGNLVDQKKTLTIIR